MKQQLYKSHVLGYPRIGAKRELKWALEKYWRSEITAAQLEQTASQLRLLHWKEQSNAGLDFVTVNDFSLYDHVLDTACAFGIIPERYGWDGWDGGQIPLDLYFALARGNEEQPALAMTKWFDTNYHYLVPEIAESLEFSLHPEKILSEFEQAKQAGFTPKPVLISPVTLLKLSRKSSLSDRDPLQRIGDLLPHYASLINALLENGAEWIQLDEPILSQDLSNDELEAIHRCYHYLAEHCPEAKILLTTYFGTLGDHLEHVLPLPVAGLHIDLCSGENNLPAVLENFPKDKVLSLGLISGRNVWASNLKEKKNLILLANEHLTEDQIWVASSCSLQHVPYSLDVETELENPLRGYLAFAAEKLLELNLLSIFQIDPQADLAIRRSAQDHYTRLTAKLANVASIREKCSTLNTPENVSRSSFSQRQQIQKEALNLPLLPTTTIGSFPQTQQVRKLRSRYLKGNISEQDYEEALFQEMKDCIEKQEEIGLDVLVHGEFERNDMVEFFADKLQGYAFTNYGWVQSYGSRCVKPPIIWADVAREKSLSGKWITKAQQLTEKPVKGMLSGPITMLQWSFVRDDISRAEVALQIAVALREELEELESAGIKIIQVDEPALREGLPLRKSEQAHYLDWAVNAFKLATSGVEDSTQIHTHMCYGKFSDIFQAIIDLDADVISIEATRNKLAILDSFIEQQYPNEIGLGIWDIHSPRVPSIDELNKLVTKAVATIDPSRVWVNPDCGLKTRGWPETEASLRNLVAAAKHQRTLLHEKRKCVSA